MIVIWKECNNLCSLNRRLLMTNYNRCKTMHNSPIGSGYCEDLSRSSYDGTSLSNRNHCCLGSLHSSNISSRVRSNPPFVVHQKRHFHLPNPFRKRQNFLPLDKVPPGSELIYSTTLSGYIAYFYPFIVLGSFPIACVAAFDILTAMPPEPMAASLPFFIYSDPLQFIIIVSSISTLALIMHMFAKRCPLRIYYNDDIDRFIGIFASLAPWKVRRRQIEVGSVKCLYNDDAEDNEDHRIGTYRTFRGRYMMSDNKRLVLFPHCFKHPNYYNVMMGYTKHKYEQE